MAVLGHDYVSILTNFYRGIEVVSASRQAHDGAREPGGVPLFTKQVLPNGLTVVVEEIPYVRSVSVGIWVGAGSRYECDENAGISHFLEHLFFKGTERRSAKDIAESIEGVGGQLNAFTAKEYACYYAKVLDDHLPLAMDVLSDMIQHSRFTTPDIEKERGVILEEIRMYEDTPDELVHDLFLQTVWEGHPLGRAILGTEESVGFLDRERIVSYYKRMYCPDNVVVAAAGHVTAQQMVDMVVDKFGDMNGCSTKLPLVSPETHSDILLKAKATEQVHLCMGSKAVPLDDDDYYATQVLNSITGGGSSSRLFQEIREERGLAYSVYSYISAYKDAGLFTAYAGMSPDQAAAVTELMMKVLSKLADEGPTTEELERAREQLKGGLMLGLESTSNRMTRIGKNEITLGRHITPDEIIDKVNTVTLEDINRLAAHFFRPASFTVVGLGPVDRTGLSGIIRDWRKPPVKV